MKRLRLVSLCSLQTLLAGCVFLGPSSARKSQPAASSQEAQAKSEEAAIASALAQITEVRPDYKIGPADLIHVTVYQDADLSRKVRVSQNGSISIPLVGAVQIGGLALYDAERVVADKLRSYLVDPQVSLFIEEYGNKQIYVLGEVKKPGSYAIPTESRLTALEAISIAGGFTAIAAKDRTKVIRKVSGKSQSLTVEVSSITKRGEKEKDLPLQPNDVVFVPQSFF